MSTRIGGGGGGGGGGQFQSGRGDKGNTCHRQLGKDGAGGLIVGSWGGGANSLCKQRGRGRGATETKGGQRVLEYRHAFQHSLLMVRRMPYYKQAHRLLILEIKGSVNMVR